MPLLTDIKDNQYKPLNYPLIPPHNNPPPQPQLNKHVVTVPGSDLHPAFVDTNFFLDSDSLPQPDEIAIFTSYLVLNKNNQIVNRTRFLRSVTLWFTVLLIEQVTRHKRFLDYLNRPILNYYTWKTFIDESYIINYLNKYYIKISINVKKIKIIKIKIKYTYYENRDNLVFYTKKIFT